jgi:cephalosporin hydroxylase
VSEFEERNRSSIERMGADNDLRKRSRDWIAASARHEYTYHFTWLGLPIIQHPQDIVAVQEIIWETRPDLIIETGIARGGSLVFYASMLELTGGDGRVIGIDIDIRAPNRRAIEEHPLAGRIEMVEGSSVDALVIERVRELAAGRDRVLVILDSLHTHEHVLRELELYSELVQPGGYLVVFDTIIEEMPAGSYPDRPWDRGNSPATAVEAFLRENDGFEVVHQIEDKLMITAAPGGYLRRVRR